jgi:hypothetical protein
MITPTNTTSQNKYPTITTIERASPTSGRANWRQREKVKDVHLSSMAAGRKRKYFPKSLHHLHVPLALGRKLGPQPFVLVMPLCSVVPIKFALSFQVRP